MAIIEGAVSQIGADVDPGRKALRASVQPLEALGHYRLCATSGLLTVVAARTATAGHLFSLRAPAVNIAYIQRFKMSWRTIAGFTAAQEVGFKLFRLTGYSANHSGGTDIVLTSPQFKKRTSMPSTTLQSVRIGTTGALTAGTHTFDTNELLSMQYAELAAGAAVPKGFCEAKIETFDTEYGMLVTGNEGFAITNEILMGAGGTGRLTVEIDWIEAAAF